MSSASDLGFPDATPGPAPDLYVRDLVTGELARITSTPDGTDGGNGATSSGQFSPDGTKVLFQSLASNLGPVDTNGVSDIYIHDLESGTTDLVTTNPAGTDGANGASRNPGFSPDGNVIAFTSVASDLGPTDANGADDVYVRDVATHANELVSVDVAGTGAGDAASSASPSFDAAGTRLVFTSTARNLVSGPTSGSNAYVRDLVSDTTVLASIGTAGAALPSGDGAVAAVIDPTGSTVAFTYRTLLGATGPTRDQIYVRDLATETTRLVSRTGQTPGNDSSVGPLFSPNGARLAFTSGASNLVTGDGNGFRDVFVYDLDADAVGLVSVDVHGTTPDGQSLNPRFTPDGSKLAFVSNAGGLVAGFLGRSSDLYLRDLEAERTELVSLDPAGTSRGGFVTGGGRFSADGRTVAYGGSSSTLDGRPVPPAISQVFVGRLTPFAIVDLTVGVTRLDPPPAGAPWAVEVTVTNNGPDATSAVALGYFVPYVGGGIVVTTDDGTCTTTISSGDQIVGCTLGGIDAGAAASIVVSGTQPFGGTVSTVAHVSGPRLTDPVPADNTATYVLEGA